MSVSLALASSFSLGGLAVSSLVFTNDAYAQEYAGAKKTKAQGRIELSEIIARDVLEIQEAIYLYLDSADSEAVLNTYETAVGREDFIQNVLIREGYYSGSMHSPMDTLYSTRVVGDEIEILVDTANASLARTTKNLLPHSQSAGATIISASLALPSRRGQVEHPEVVSRLDGEQHFETAINMGDNNIDNIHLLTTQHIDGAEEVNAPLVETQTTQTDLLTFNDEDTNIITGEGGELVVSANTNLDVGVIDLGSDGNAADLLGHGGTITEVNTLGTDTANVTDLTAKHIDTDTLDVSDKATFNDLEVLEDLTGIDIEVLEHTDTNTAFAGDLTAQTATITTLDGDTLEAQTGTGDNANVSGHTLVRDTTTLSGKLEAQSVHGESLTAEDVTTKHFNANAPSTITHLQGAQSGLGGQVIANTVNTNTSATQMLQATQGHTNTLQGESITMDEGTFTQSLNVVSGEVDTVQSRDYAFSNAGSGNSNFQVNNASVSNTVTLDTLKAEDITGKGSGSNKNTLDVQNTLDISDTLTVSGHSVFDDLYSQDGLVFSADGKAGSTVNAGFIYVTNTAKAQTITANQGDLGAITTNNVDVSGTLSANHVSATGNTTISGELSANNMSGNSLVVNQNVSANTLNAGSVHAGNITTTNDAISSNSTININYDMIKGMKGDLDNCMDVSQYCFPQQPRVKLDCPVLLTGGRCRVGQENEYVTATFTAQVLDCRHGCKYTWSIPSGTTVVNGCTNGQTAEGQTANPSCTVKNTSPLNPQNEFDSSITLSGSSVKDPSLIDSKTLAFKLKNTKIEDPFENSPTAVCVGTCSHDLAAGASANAVIDTSFTATSYLKLSDYRITRSVDWGTKDATCYSSHSGSDSGGEGATSSGRAIITHNGEQDATCSGNVAINVAYRMSNGQTVSKSASAGYSITSKPEIKDPPFGALNYSCSSGSHGASEGRWNGNTYVCQVAGHGINSGTTGSASVTVKLNYPENEYTGLPASAFATASVGAHEGGTARGSDGFTVTHIPTGTTISYGVSLTVRHDAQIE